MLVFLRLILILIFCWSCSSGPPNLTECIYIALPRGWYQKLEKKPLDKKEIACSYIVSADKDFTSSKNRIGITKRHISPVSRKDIRNAHAGKISGRKDGQLGELQGRFSWDTATYTQDGKIIFRGMAYHQNHLISFVSFFEPSEFDKRKLDIEKIIKLLYSP